MTAQPFDPNASLPDLHIQKRSWEPAARHYRDLTEQEKAVNVSDVGATEWATNYWGNILSEPTEDHARDMVARRFGILLFKRAPMGEWELVTP